MWREFRAIWLKHRGALAVAREAETSAREAERRALAIGPLIGRVKLLQTLRRRVVTPREELEAIPLEKLEALAAQLERKLPGQAGVV